MWQIVPRLSLVVVREGQEPSPALPPVRILPLHMAPPPLARGRPGGRGGNPSSDPVWVVGDVRGELLTPPIVGAVAELTRLRGRSFYLPGELGEWDVVLAPVFEYAAEKTLLTNFSAVAPWCWRSILHACGKVGRIARL
jgi:hypothetical protein